MPNSGYPCYVRIGDEHGQELVELPTENDGTILLSTITAQFEDAIGLRFKSESGAWRGVRVTNGVLDPPLEGWGYGEYYITLPKKAVKRKVDDGDDYVNVKRKPMQEDYLQDLIVLGLPWSLTLDEMKTHFEQYGELDLHEIKIDKDTKKSKGFGFIRFKTAKAAEAALAAHHEIGGRKCEVQFPLKQSTPNEFPTKLFIGQLPGGTTQDDLREHFSHYGNLKDVYIPTKFSGFGFVTFCSQQAANDVLNNQHIINGNYVNIAFPSPKPGEIPNMEQQQPSYGNSNNIQGQQSNANFNMLGGMQGSSQGGYVQTNMQVHNIHSSMQVKNMEGINMSPRNMRRSEYGNQGD